MTPTIYRSMAWANERFGLSCFDNSGLKKTLLKMVVLDNSSSANTSNSNSSTKQKVSKLCAHFTFSGVIFTSQHRRHWMVPSPSRNEFAHFFFVWSLRLGHVIAVLLLPKTAFNF
jgi:hypothetical protein